MKHHPLGYKTRTDVVIDAHREFQAAYGAPFHDYQNTHDTTLTRKAVRAMVTPCALRVMCDAHYAEPRVDIPNQNLIRLLPDYSP